ncbi:MAG: hypothetical protein OXI12_12295, partial [Gammaproteobacteria bacterium]|nr:hypothetical protein [Gammaproteobacteria bacterium]
MKKIGLVGVGTFALIVLMRMFFGGEAAAAGAASVDHAAPTGEVPAPTAAAPTGAAPNGPADGGASPAIPPSPAAATTPALQEAQEAPPQEAPRRRRWRSYNRYPGPIPTPEEWRAPEGPVRIALQVGHWRTEEAPRELSGL